MTIVSWPAGIGIRNIAWDFDEPAQVNRSEWTRKSKVTILPLASMASASFELVPMIGDGRVLAWRAFLFQLRGVVNSFRLKAIEGSQTVSGSPVVDGAGQSGFTLATRGWPASSAVMKAGMLATLNDQLLGLAADVVSDANGKATLTLHRYLRSSPVDGLALEVLNPTALVRRKSTTAGWSVDPGKLYGSKLEVEEAF